MKAFLRMGCMLFAAMLIAASVYAQSEAEEALKRADRQFQDQEYLRAYLTLRDVVPLYPKDEKLKVKFVRVAILAGSLDDAYEVLSQLVLEEKDPDPEWLYLLGEILRHDGQYEEGSRYYKEALTKLKPDERLAKVIVVKLEQSGTALEWESKARLGEVKLLPEAVNTAYNDWAPHYSPTIEGRIYFSSDRYLQVEEYSSEESSIFFADEIDFNRFVVRAVEYNNISEQAEELLGFTDNGTTLLFSPFGQTDIYTETTEKFEGKWRALPFYQPENEDCCLQLINDSIAVFSSKRKGGLGSYDIYYTEKTDGQWGRPQNLGGNVNTIFDELDPFVDPEKGLLFFSSNRRGGVGGLDIYYSTKSPAATRWEPSSFAGMGVNSPADDRGLKLRNDARSAIFASERKTGMGGWDIYRLTFEYDLLDGKPLGFENE